jgi:hypothetical protein
MTQLWRIREVELRAATLDFRSAGLDRTSVTQAWVDATCLCNARELVEGGQPEIQIVVCEHCGITHCEPGGWVAPRWTGSGVILLPAFRLMEDVAPDDRGSAGEYAPPTYVRSRGIPMLDARAAKALPLGRSLADLPMVSGSELIRWAQWCAPSNLLGRFPNAPTLQRDALVAASSGDLAAGVAAVTASLAEHAGRAPYVLRERGSDESALTFYADAPGSPEWAPLVVGEAGWLLSPVPGLVAEPTE